MDRNGDAFLDVPLSQQYNILNRWQYTDAEKGWVGFGSIRLMQDDKQLGAIGFDPDQDQNQNRIWGSEIDTKTNFIIIFMCKFGLNVFSYSIDSN